MAIEIAVRIPRGYSLKELQAAAELCGAKVQKMNDVITKQELATLTVGDHFNINGDWFRIARGTVTCYDDGTIDQPEETIVIDSSEFQAKDGHDAGATVYESTSGYIGVWR